MVIEAYHTNRLGQSVDLVNEIDGEVIFPFSNGSIIRFCFNSDDYVLEEETLSDEENTESEVYYSFFKYNKYMTLNVKIPYHLLDMLYLLKVVRNKTLVYDNERHTIKDIIVEKLSHNYGVCGVSLQLLLTETAVSGNY